MQNIYCKRRKFIDNYSGLDSLTKSEVELYVGERFNDYYKQTWEKLNKSSHKISFNLGSFFFLNFWLAYRKMFKWAYGLMLTTLAIQIIANYTPRFVDIIFNIIDVVLWLAMIFWGDYLYQKHTLKEVQKLREKYPNLDQRVEYLMNKGGASSKAVWALICISLTTATLTTYLESLITKL
jgi:hypothetical protein